MSPHLYICLCHSHQTSIRDDREGWSVSAASSHGNSLLTIPHSQVMSFLFKLFITISTFFFHSLSLFLCLSIPLSLVLSGSICFSFFFLLTLSISLSHHFHSELPPSSLCLFGLLLWDSLPLECTWCCHYSNCREKLPPSDIRLPEGCTAFINAVIDLKSPS